MQSGLSVNAIRKIETIPVDKIKEKMKFYEKSEASIQAFEKRVNFLQSMVGQDKTLNQINREIINASKIGWANI